MSSYSESYALGLDEPLSILRSPRIKLYQLKSLKFRSFKALLCRIKLLHQIAYSLINIAEVRQSDIETWQKAKQVLQEYIPHELHLSKTRDRGLSL